MLLEIDDGSWGETLCSLEQCQQHRRRVNVVKRFRGPSMACVLDKVKRELGAEAFVLGTRQVRGGLLRGQQIEVLATRGDWVAAGRTRPRIKKSPEFRDKQIVSLQRQVAELREDVRQLTDELEAKRA